VLSKIYFRHLSSLKPLACPNTHNIVKKYKNYKYKEFVFLAVVKYYNCKLCQDII